MPVTDAAIATEIAHLRDAGLLPYLSADTPAYVLTHLWAFVAGDLTYKEQQSAR